MLLVPSISGLFKWRQFEPEVILLAVGWYLRFSKMDNYEQRSAETPDLLLTVQELPKEE